MVILRRTERAIVRSMRGVKLVDKKNTEELMKMLGLKETLDKMAKANGVRWYGHVVSSRAGLRRGLMGLQPQAHRPK